MTTQIHDLDRLTEAVIGAAINVHRELGPGFLESAYEEAMAVELELSGLTARRQVVFPILYKDCIVGEPRLDFLVEEQLVVELKAVEAVQRIHMAQVHSYLKAADLRLGLLINFNVVTLIQGVRRIVRGPGSE